MLLKNINVTNFSPHGMPIRRKKESLKRNSERQNPTTGKNTRRAARGQKTWLNYSDPFRKSRIDNLIF